MPKQRFDDRVAATLPDWRDVWGVLRDGGFSTRVTADEVARVPRVPAGAALPRAGADEVAVTWIGHATTLVQVAGVTFVTDPVWSNGIPGGVRRQTPPGLPWAVVADRVDAILVSHNHYDHLDAPTLKRFPRDTPVFAPLGLAAWFRRRGFTDVTERDWGETVPFRGVDVACVPAQHWSRRGPFDRNASLWCGWVVKPADAREGGVWFAGDTAYNAEAFRAIGDAHPALDVAILPVGAYAPRWFMKNAHQDPAEAVRACADVGGVRGMLPVHWGTFVLSQEPFLAPVEWTRAAWAAAGLPRDALWDVALGETRVLS